MNPLLPPQYFIPDVEARVWADGRLYLYGSQDVGGNETYCSYAYRVFSSADMNAWTDHGVSFRSLDPAADVPWGPSPLFAPDCIYRNGRYYLFFCTADQGEGVAVSESPAGPFRDAIPVAGAHGDGIDPAVFIDDDGQAYLYWGQFHLRGAQLREDLGGIQPDTLVTSLLSEDAHGFHEGASLRKRNGRYYLVYTDISRGRATCLSYAVANAPLGPFTKGGVIIDNTGCDPATWNNHGSIQAFGGRWFVFYHRSSRGTRYSRRVCVEPIAFTPDGAIPEVEMTTQGHGAPLPATAWIPAWRACLLHGRVRTAPTHASPPTEPECLDHFHHGDRAAFKDVDFGDGVAGIEMQLASATDGGSVEVRLDHPAGPRIAMVLVRPTGGWRDWQPARAPVIDVRGTHAVYLVAKGPIAAYPSAVTALLAFRFTPA